MQIGLIIIGSELLTGKRRDGHMTRAIETLATRNLELDWATYIGDDPPRLGAELQRAMQANELVFSFGGIGATPDDHTRAAAAQAAGVDLALHPQAGKIIEDRFGADAYPQRIHMAHLPVGARLIPNPVNRIAGFSLGHVHFVPGFPKMAWPMMDWVLDEHYIHLSAGEGNIEELFTLPGTSEGQLIALMQALIAQHPSIKLSCLPHMDGDYRETELGLRGARALVDDAAAWLRAQLDAQGFTWKRRGA